MARFFARLKVSGKHFPQPAVINHADDNSLSSNIIAE
jgi:hypothetical protein